MRKAPKIPHPNGVFDMEELSLDADTIREIMYFKAIDLEVEQEIAEQLDAALCSLLGINDPEPIIGQP
jgi:hypothetical protein